MQTDKVQALAGPADTGPAAALKLSRRARRLQEARQQAHRQALLDEYFALRARMGSLEDFFQRTTDPGLISACIYEMSAAQQQYGVLLGQLKAEGVTCQSILRCPSR